MKIHVGIRRTSNFWKSASESRFTENALLDAQRNGGKGLGGVDICEEWATATVLADERSEEQELVGYFERRSRAMIRIE